MNRLKYIDWIKGFAMILVVFGHVYTVYDSRFRQWIYSFHVPIFFFISGYLLYNSYIKKNEMNYDVIKSIKTIFIPYITFSIFNIIAQALYSHIRNKDVLDSIKYQAERLINLRGVTATWFLITLFIVVVLFKFLYKTFKNKKLFIISIIILLLIPFIYQNVNSEYIKALYKSFIALFFFTVGFFSYKYTSEKDIPWLATILMFVGSIICSYYLGYSNLASLNIAKPILFLTSGVVGSVSFLFLFKKIASYNIELKSLTYIGTNSLIYLGTHMNLSFFLTYAYTNVFDSPLMLDWKIRAPLLTILTIIVDIIFVYIFNNYLYMLIGKNRPQRHNFK